MALVPVAADATTTGTVRVLYLIPQDRSFRSDYFSAVRNAALDLQSWYRAQLGGATFSLYSSQPEVCQLPNSASYYAFDSWSKVLADVQSCAPVSYSGSTYTWVLYVDIVHACNAPGRLGAGTTGLTMMPRQDLDGLVGARVSDDCGMEWIQPVSRWIGGAGHELGHAFGLGHPPGCDAGSSTCDYNALMWAGYAQYPATYLRPDDKQILRASSFFDVPPNSGAFSKISPTNAASSISSPATISWGASAGATGYQYCVDGINNSTCDSGWVETTSLSAVASGLTSGATYYWQVRATAAGGVTDANGGVWWNFTVAANPFGAVDTPLNNTTGVTGAVPFTGWALDDVGIASVMICRAAFGGELAPVDPNCGGAAQIFVGFGTFIDGARTDVAAAYPTYPMNTRAGWGFMVLTNMLPNQGNGTYQFFMYAQDRDGHTTQLGTRTMTCANASATKPFGAIDTPTQGGPASGTNFINFGWALTPQPKIIPINGSTMTVMVDGAPLGPVDYNHERPDIEALFPGFQNTAGANGAVGFRVIDTTTLTNGLHTISWTVTDSLGVTEGIGSRFFSVVNGSGAVTAAVEGAASSRVRATAEIIAAAPQDDAPVLARRGWDLDGPWQWYGVGGAGRAVIRGEEVDRFELALGEHEGARYTGYLRVGEELAPLPIGSQLDATTGQFTWAPGVGFIGRYDLVFVRWEGTRAVARHEVRVILAPKGSGHVGVQVAIDTPRSQQDVGQPFVLAGWAADLDAAAGTGIDTLHVWAYPSTGGAPVFLGTPALGGARPDVAAIHGDQFRTSGFGLTLQGLAPGTYDLAVFPWSNVTGAFAPPSVVQLTVR